MQESKERGWSPYVTGALTGFLLVLSVLLAGKYFGASTTFARSAGMIEKVFQDERVSQMAYFQKYTPKIDWQFMFVVGIFLGALIASTTSGTFQVKSVPDMWEKRFGSSTGKRGIVAFIGGVVAVFGARLAGG